MKTPESEHSGFGLTAAGFPEENAPRVCAGRPGPYRETKAELDGGGWCAERES
jgi:hypothetical protein